MDAAKIIMIVEDNVINLKLASDILEIDGFKVLRCYDAETALTTLTYATPDLILMDIALPGMDGLQLTRQLKMDDNTRHIKIIALTAFAMKGDREKVMAAGCDGYITKPIDTRKLSQQVAEFLNSNS